MRRSEIRKLLDEYADERLPARSDLWPAIRRQAQARAPQAGRIFIEPAGRRVSMLLPAALVGVLVAAAILGPLLLSGSPPGLPGTPLPTNTAASAASPGPSAPDAYYANLFTGKLAARLGVDPARLDAAFAAAAVAAADQAVRDGSLTPAQAAQAKAAAGPGLGTLLIQALPLAGAGGKGSSDPLLDQLLLTPTP